MLDPSLPNPLTVTDYYLRAVLVELQAVHAELAACRAAGLAGTEPRPRSGKPPNAVVELREPARKR